MRSRRGPWRAARDSSLVARGSTLTVCSSDSLGDVGAIRRDSAMEAVIDRHRGTPTKIVSDARDVGHEIAGLNLFGEGRPFDELNAAATRGGTDGSRHIDDC